MVKRNGNKKGRGLERYFSREKGIWEVLKVKESIGSLRIERSLV